jgi:hypothetical protein
MSVLYPVAAVAKIQQYREPSYFMIYDLVLWQYIQVAILHSDAIIDLFAYRTLNINV